MSYTALVLDENSRNTLIERFKNNIPQDWEIIAHHMTINMGPASNGPASNMVENQAPLTVTSFAQDNLVMAVGVSSPIPSKNTIKHITLAVNRKDGGKPFLSNKLNQWSPVSPFTLKGTIKEL